MSSLVYVTLSAFVVLALSVNGLTVSKEAPAASASSLTSDQILTMLNVTKGSPQEAMLNKLKAMNTSELHALMNQTMTHLGGNSTLREGKQFFGGFGGGGISPLLLALLVGGRGGFGGGFGGGGFGGGSPIFIPAPAPAPAQSSGGGDDFAALAALTLLGLAVISRFPTQG